LPARTAPEEFKGDRRNSKGTCYFEEFKGDKEFKGDMLL
jgi:hypothetical protein